ncbi:MAG: band-7 C-terminal domain-containing protein [Syntrophales bacterium]|nr:band-7 C-terminal domain-containing protein [Syntrophales bacterium]
MIDAIDQAAQINEAQGKAAQVTLVAEADAKRIELIAKATGEGISKVAAAIKDQGGIEALNMRLAEQYIVQLGNLAKTTNTIIMPSNVADVAGIIAAAMSTVREVR